MTTPREENALTLASLLGVASEEAARLLDCTIAIRWDPADKGASAIAAHLEALLSRTVNGVIFNALPLQAKAEVVIGRLAAERPDALRVSLGEDEIRIGGDALRAPIPDGPKVVACFAACYAAGMAIKVALGATVKLPGPRPETGLAIPLKCLLGEDALWAAARVNLGRTHLAGAGAIGNAFLYGLTLFDVEGELVVVDNDLVSEGNLNRCLFFEHADIGQPKAVILARKASALLQTVTLTPEPMTLRELGKVATDLRWLRRLVVGVDSPRSRRSLQAELPREVFDASTTGVLECVFHHHCQPTGHACLSCIYYESADEQAHERHVATSLGVSLEDVQEREVSASAAKLIHGHLPHVAIDELVGRPYDSLFKALCGQGRLVTGDAQQVLAPFAFVSVFAGVYLAVEFVRRLAGNAGVQEFNYWRLSPWSPPVEPLKTLRPRHVRCDCCSQPATLRAIRELWG